MKLTDVWSYQNLLDLINKVAKESCNPSCLIEGLLTFDPLGAPEIVFTILQPKVVRGKYQLIVSKRLRKCFPNILKWSVDDCLYILENMVKKLRLEPII